jgi:hypothetical protein
MSYTKHHHVLRGTPQIYNYFLKQNIFIPRLTAKRNLNEAEIVMWTEYMWLSTEFSVGACEQ